MPLGARLFEAEISKRVPGENPAFDARTNATGALDGLPAAALSHGPRSNAQPISIRNVPHGGTRQVSFFEDYYNRIYLLPSRVDFGAISGETSFPFVVWNAYLAPQNLSQILLINAEGIGLDGPAIPTNYKPLQTRSYSAHANDQGPPTINATIQFTFDGIALPYSLPVVGVRAFVTPFRPNWRQPVKINYEFKTEIIRSRSGREQRRAVRSAPRKRIEFQASASGPAFHKINRVMAAGQGRTIIMPEYPRAAYSAVGMAPGALQIQVDSVPFWVTPTMTVCLINGDMIEVRRVDSIAAPFIVFDSSSATEWPPGTQVVQAQSGVFPDALQGRRETNGVGTYSVVFEMTPASEPIVDSGARNPTFNGREVFLVRPNWAQTPEITYQHAKEIVDYGAGRIARFVPADFAQRTMRFTYLKKSFDEADQTREFFERMKGQRGEFYGPTWENDLPLKVDSPATTNTLRTAGQEIASAYKDDTVLKAVAILHRDGSWRFNTIANIVAISDENGSDTLVNCFDPWPVDIRVDDVVMICWLPVWRFATDTLSVDWLTNHAAQFQLTMLTLEAFAPE